jgi:UDP-glucose 4-epimerase
MKKILITGANSYIGTSFETYINARSESYLVETVDLISPDWRNTSFSGYDTVFHVAGLAHVDVRSVSEEQKKMYYTVNTDLAEETAKKAKTDGVKQFIFMSSAIVFGDSAPIGTEKVITGSTLPSPTNCYSDSKFQAEKRILPLDDSSFKVVILRPPMIYGKGSKGNYPILAKMSKKLPFFPKVKNCRSMLYVENLCEFVRLMVENEERGIFHPQNAEYSNTSELVRCIAKAHNKKILIFPGFAWLCRLLSPFTGLVNKAFGNFCYDQKMSEYKDPYQIFTLKDSIEKTERSE